MRAGRVLVAFFLSVASSVLAEPFRLDDTYIGYKFSDGFQWWSSDDPTHGRVNYVDKDTAFQKNLSFVSDTKFIMRADTFHVVPPNSRGRDSVRISSNATYGDSVMVLDIDHMPAGCATWPAFWTLSSAGPWPRGGEIDIIEGVNLQGDNRVSLHTAPNCVMQHDRNQTGHTISANCDASVNYNQGCSTAFTKGKNSYGAAFNTNGGGWYVMERSSRGVNVWFYPRDDHDVPEVVRCGGSILDPAQIKRVPDAEFPWDHCDYCSHFDAHNIVFDLTFCGDWAGADFSPSCGDCSCNDYVDKNPGAFTEAYWEINSLRIYTPLQGSLQLNSPDAY